MKRLRMQRICFLRDQGSLGKESSGEGSGESKQRAIKMRRSYLDGTKDHRERRHDGFTGGERDTQALSGPGPEWKPLAREA